MLSRAHQCQSLLLLLLLLIFGFSTATAFELKTTDSEAATNAFDDNSFSQHQPPVASSAAAEETTALDDGSSSQTSITYEKNNEFLGIPGTTQTKNGYDTALGNDAICWIGAAADDEANATTTTAVDELVKTVFPNPLVENFTLLGKTEILDECPMGNTVTVQKPAESLRGERLRTEKYYNYSLYVELDLDTLDGDYIVSDNGTATIALQVVICSLGKSGFCSPFVHEQANARDAIDAANSGEEIKATEKGDLHGGTHIHSPWVFLDVGDKRKFTANVSVPMIALHPGDYFVIGTVQLYTGINGTDAFRWDIANALPVEAGDGRYVLYQAPPDIREVSNGVLYFSYAAIAIASAVILFFIGQTLLNRRHQVLQLSQGDFLIVFLLGALVATCSTFLLVPKNNDYCHFRYPLIVIPIHLMYAVTVGRLWRIHAVISPLLLEHLSKGNPGLVQRFVEAITYVSVTLRNMFVMKKENKRRNVAGSKKQQISQFQLALVIAIFTLPQIMIQVVALIVQPQERTVVFNDDESIGRATCGSNVPTSESLVMYSFILLVLLVIILLVMAHSSRKLPSLFNETHVIYDSTFLSFVLMLLGGAVIILTNSPSSSPDVPYFVSLILILSITLNAAVRIMLPKLKMVWKNETVVVSKLVTDHHRKAREKELRGSAIDGVSGLDASDSRYQNNFSRGGDYDMSQQNHFLPQTVHSDSNDTKLMHGRSSIASGRSSVTSNEGGPDNSSNNDAFNSSLKAFADCDVEGRASTDDFLLDKLEPVALLEDDEPVDLEVCGKILETGAADQTSSTDLDVESGESWSAPGKSSTNPTPLDQVHPQQIAPVTKAQAEEHPAGGANDGHSTDDGITDDEHELETAAAAASAFGPVGGKHRKKVSFFEQGASGFLKNAMAKGLSWRSPERGMEDAMTSSHSVNTPAPDTETNDVEQKKKEPRKRGKKRLADRMVVTEDETPARRLVLKMLDLQDQLEAVNNKIMSGLAVTKEDWGVITKLTSRLDRTFNEEVEFEWDIAQRYDESLQHIMPSDMVGATPKKGHHSVDNHGGNHEKRGSGSKEKETPLKGIMRHVGNNEHIGDGSKKDKKLNGINRTRNDPTCQSKEPAALAHDNAESLGQPTEPSALAVDSDDGSLQHSAHQPAPNLVDHQDSCFSDEEVDRIYFV